MNAFEEEELVSDDQLFNCLSQNPAEENKDMQLNPGVLKEKEIGEAKAVLEKHGLFKTRESNQSRTSSVILFGQQDNSSVKKIASKAAGKQHDKLEQQSVRSGGTINSVISRSTNGRFEAKYKVGDKTASGAIIKEIREEDWYLIEKDKKGNSYYKCLKCNHALKTRKDDRKKHCCK